jgi:hypothetical protein
MSQKTTIWIDAIAKMLARLVIIAAGGARRMISHYLCAVAA